MNTELEVAKLRTRVVRLEGQVAFLYKHLALEFVPEAEAGDDPRIVEQLKKGNFLAAVKIYRERTEATLDDATQAVQEMQGRLGL